ncbi:hypothetical protein TNCV_2967021 [Trichonephila clavipes]|nr:hypothetical protein TNCV_2967021 [Trichonephila clavipes]
MVHFFDLIQSGVNTGSLVVMVMSRSRRVMNSCLSAIQDHRVEGLMHDKSAVDRSSHVGMVWKLEEWGSSAGVILVT